MNETRAEMEKVLEFVNTRDVETDVDELATAVDLKDWLVARDLLTPAGTVGTADLERARQLREGIRAALVAHDLDHTAAAPSDTVATVPLQLVIAGDGSVTLGPASGGADAALAQLVAAIPAAVADGTWDRMKACPADDCQWAFFDESRNRSRRWCSMRVCGNREKTRSFRQRHQAD